ncbi:hypothetical protein Tco_0281014 [Tanacetum coccineum]
MIRQHAGQHFGSSSLAALSIRERTWATLGRDKTKITRKPSKTGKHGHGKRKSTKEARNSRPKSKSQSSQSTLGQLRVKNECAFTIKGVERNISSEESSTSMAREKDVILIGKVKQRITRGLEKAQGMG